MNLVDVEIQRPVEALQRLECLEKGISEYWTSTSGYPYRHPVDKNTVKLAEVCARQVNEKFIRFGSSINSMKRIILKRLIFD